jgi:hypothetical protein
MYSKSFAIGFVALALIFFVLFLTVVNEKIFFIIHSALCIEFIVLLFAQIHHYNSSPYDYFNYMYYYFHPLIHILSRTGLYVVEDKHLAVMCFLFIFVLGTLSLLLVCRPDKLSLMENLIYRYAKHQYKNNEASVFSNPNDKIYIIRRIVFFIGVVFFWYPTFILAALGNGVCFWPSNAIFFLIYSKSPVVGLIALFLAFILLFMAAFNEKIFLNIHRLLMLDLMLSVVMIVFGYGYDANIYDMSDRLIYFHDFFLPLVYFLKNAGLLVNEDPKLIITYMNGIFIWGPIFIMGLCGPFKSKRLLKKINEEMNDMQNG